MTPACRRCRLQAKFGDEGVRQLQERKKREADMAAEGMDANLIPLGPRVRACEGADGHEGAKGGWEATSSSWARGWV